MAVYVVMEPRGSTPEGRSEETVFVRDGFSLLAFLLPALWLLWHRLWIEAVLAFAAYLVLGMVGDALALTPLAVLLLSCLISLYVGLEGPALRIAALRRRGWREWGVIKADGREDAATRYFAEASRSGEPVQPTGERTTPAPRARQGGAALGLLDYPGAR